MTVLGSRAMNVLSTDLPSVIGECLDEDGWRSRSRRERRASCVRPRTSVALFVNVCCGGVPVPPVTAPAVAVIVTVPAVGVPAAIVPTFQRTIVPSGEGMTVGAGSAGDEVRRRT